MLDNILFILGLIFYSFVFFFAASNEFFFRFYSFLLLFVFVFFFFFFFIARNTCHWDLKLSLALFSSPFVCTTPIRTKRTIFNMRQM